MEEEIREDGTPEGASHYQKTSIQPIEMFQQIFPKEMVYGFCVCNAFKYLYRLKQKGQEAKDIEKAATYARWAADLLEGKTINPREKEWNHADCAEIKEKRPESIRTLFRCIPPFFKGFWEIRIF